MNIFTGMAQFVLDDFMTTQSSSIGAWGVEKSDLCICHNIAILQKTAPSILQILPVSNRFSLSLHTQGCVVYLARKNRQYLATIHPFTLGHRKTSIHANK